MPDRNSKTAEKAGLSTGEIDRFRSALLDWFERHKRDLPWRRTRDPYAIWVSEIMLQQTRVAAAIPYYERFLERFPDCRELAQASESDLLAHWAGLGYYHRARNLQKAAQLICGQAAFPQTHASIRSLPGVGDYTAAAIASIAFELPHAALDGNVLRVLSRIGADPTNIASTIGRKHFAAAAQKLLDPKHPGNFNQSLMELGATICLPTNPQCLLCPLQEFCLARRAGTQNNFPVKRVPSKSVEEKRTLYWIEHRTELLLWQRPADSRLMPGFWELPEPEHLPSVTPAHCLGSFRHGITFHKFRFEVFEAALPKEIGPCRWVPIDALPSLPISTILRKAQRLFEQKIGSATAAVAGN